MGVVLQAPFSWIASGILREHTVSSSFSVYSHKQKRQSVSGSSESLPSPVCTHTEEIWSAAPPCTFNFAIDGNVCDFGLKLDVNFVLKGKKAPYFSQCEYRGASILRALVKIPYRLHPLFNYGRNLARKRKKRQFHCLILLEPHLVNLLQTEFHIYHGWHTPTTFCCVTININE